MQAGTWALALPCVERQWWVKLQLWHFFLPGLLRTWKTPRPWRRGWNIGKAASSTCANRGTTDHFIWHPGNNFFPSDQDLFNTIGGSGVGEGNWHGLCPSSFPRPAQPPIESKLNLWDAGSTAGASLDPRVYISTSSIPPLFCCTLTFSQVDVAIFSALGPKKGPQCFPGLEHLLCNGNHYWESGGWQER